ncbi:MAG: 7-cyano-7-deazaguanine synthase, partial [Sulfuricaulis sp.]|nr:7-cyano-7-deazaguanine synthase [Sulfuricaulis sp.]
MHKALRDSLEFLSDDFYGFSFYPGKGAPEMQGYFKFGHTVAGMQAPELVTLFSGGLDSLGGAIHEIVRNKQHVALVNHQSTDKFGRTYDELLKRLRAKCGVFQPMHLRVEVNKKGIEAKDHYQRARSFLFAALGGTVAMMLGLRELRFYENGVLSLNLPICGQLVGARATRTTHPRVIAGYQDLLTLLAGEKFAVKTPFLWHTKGDVVNEILGADCGSLIPFSRSCAHTWQTDNTEPHCGICSQCLDRRIAMLAAHGEQHDPLDRYGIDVFTQGRPEKEDKILGAGYIERANQVAAMRDSGEFLCRYPEVARVIPF